MCMYHKSCPKKETKESRAIEENGLRRRKKGEGRLQQARKEEEEAEVVVVVAVADMHTHI